MTRQILASTETFHNPNNGGCDCSACSGGFVPVVSSDNVDASLDPSAGGSLNGKPIWTVDQVAAHLNRTGGGFADGFNDTANVGRQNNIGDDNKTITFGFFNTQDQLETNGYVYEDGGEFYGLAEYFNFASFSDAQRGAAREAMQGWDDVVAVTFKEVSADDADINFGNLASAPTTQAYARIPTAGLDALIGGQVREIGGDTWISASQASNFQLDEGGYGLQTLAHEIGHTLGLSHPGGYNAAPGRSITYAANAEYAQDTRAYSIMSYFNGSSIAGTRHFDFNISTTVYAGTPLIHDIAAAQRIYGADMTTRTGDTIYGFNTNTGRDAFDFVKTPAPIVAIWDAGGTDTIDASGYATNQLIDLTPGSLSSIGGVTFDTAPSFDQVNTNRAAAGFPPILRATYDANMAALKANPIVGVLTDNVGIAYGAIIENAIGGSGDDRMIGNAAVNILTGNAGNDVLDGGAGADTLNGGAGIDTALYMLSDSAVTVRLDYARGTDASRRGADGSGGTAQGDFLIDIENVTGSAFNDNLRGNELANTLSGMGGDDVLEGDQGNDILIGGAGRDTLIGGTDDDRLIGGSGNDSLRGGQGNDIFVMANDDSIDIIDDFQFRQDRVDLSGIDGNEGIAGLQGLNWVGRGTIADVTKVGDVAFQSFANINAAEDALGFEIDGIAGKGAGGFVTVVFANTDNAAGIDFAMVITGRPDLEATSFIFGA